ncbi:hypothetical protein DP107_07555 [Haloglomus irregulare]|uniref:Uncharacterized protein n=1 Tax=Haloglomus irregulare TaxID=2234134 RepID=A0A554NBQ5_9EURY|nr:hypothetical protein [Haloglomus irregulare]TSD14812.1 hypothetical protein DP107_07555 [Haloglomus irregulare]
MSEPDAPRSIAEGHGRTTSPQMTVVGLVVAAGTALLLLPLLPAIAVLWLLADDEDRQVAVE